MISFRLLLQVLTVPVVIIKTAIQFYTTGTIYSRTNVEFQSSLRKNIYISVLYHLTSSYNLKDLRLVVNRPLSKIIAGFKSHPLTQILPHFAEKLNNFSYWIARSDSDVPKSEQDVVVFFHGGGFAIGMFETQLAGIIGLYHAIPESHRSNVSIVLVDYSLSSYGHRYPTQILEGLQTYTELVEQGYKKITFIGDSAGGNLSLALNRLIAYPEEAQSHFKSYDQFKSFDWSILAKLPQPRSLILISPWVQPYTPPVFPTKHGVDVYGDLGSVDSELGDWYVEGLPRDEINNFVNFGNTNYDEHWAKVEALNNSERNLLICGEREVLRDGVESWVNLIDKGGDGSKKVDYVVEKGGIHDGLFYVESFDFVKFKTTDKPDFSTKFAYLKVSQFITHLIDTN